MTTNDKKIKWYNYGAYGMTDFLGAGSSALTSAWLLFFYTTFCGLTATEGALIFAIARCFDAVASPLMGIISDNFHKTKLGKKFGRRKFFLLLGIPFVLSYILIWISGMHFMYYLVTYILFDMVYTMVLVPYETLGAEMTQDYKKRSIFSGARLFCGQVSAFVAAYIPGRLINILGKDNPKSFLYAGAIFAVVFVVILVVLNLFTWERSLEEIESYEGHENDIQEEKQSMLSRFKKIYIDLFSTFKIKAFRTHIAMYLGCYISQDIFSQVFTYFIVFALAYSTLVASNILSIISLSCIVGVLMGIFAVSRFNQASTYRFSVILFMIGTIGFVVSYFIKGSNVVMTILVASAVISGVGRGALAYIPWNIYSFIPDVDEVVTGQRREGAFAGVMTFTRKATQALAVFVTGILLDLSGFVSSAKNQSPQTVKILVLLLGLGTLIFLIIGFISSLQFKLTRQSHAVLIKEIGKFKNGQNPLDLSDKTAKTIKDLTGWDKEYLWGNNEIGFKNKMKKANELKKIESL